MNKNDSKEESILKIKKKQNFFLILSKLVSENFCTVFFVFVILQIIEIIQMIYFTYSYAIIGAPKDQEVLLQNIQNILKNSHFTVIYRGADGSFISYGFITFQNVFMIFTVYTSMFTIFAIATVLMEKYYAEKMKKLINRLSAILSLVFYFNFFILSFPVYQLYFIPLECLISPSSPFYMGDPYYCFDSVHLTFLVISVFSLIIWILFNLVFSLFVNEYFPESRIPWSGQVTKNNFILFLWKLAASIFIFFAKANINRIFIIGIIVVNLVNIIIRYKTPFMFKSGVHFFYSVRECIIFILTILNYLNYIFDITFTFPILLLSMFFTFSFVFTFFRLNDREIKKIQLKDPFEMKEINEVELYIMYLINNIEHIEDKEVRKDIYGMFLIHQERCEVNEVNDINNHLNFKCPCQEIIEFIKKMNFHIQYKSKKKTEKGEEFIEQVEEKDKEKSIINKFSSINGINREPSKLNESINQNSVKKDELKVENDQKEIEGESQEDNSENKAMKMKEYYKNCYEELKNKLYLYIKYLLVYHIIKKPRMIKLHLLYSYLCHKKLNKPFKSLYELMQAKLSKGSFVDRYLVFRYTEILETDINELNSKKEKDYYMDMKKLIQFVLSYKSYFDIMEKIVRNSVEFWQEMDGDKPNSIKIYKLGDNIANDYQSLKKYKDFFEDNYHNHFAINFTYGCFLKFVLNNPKEANILITSCIENKNKLDVSTKLIPDIRINDEVGLIIISSDLLHLGEIIYMNNNLNLLLKYNSKELIHSNVNMITPQYIATKHDMCLKNFLETGEKKVLDKEYITFAKDKAGYIIPMKLMIRMIPNLTSGLKFIGHCNQLKTNSMLLQPDPDLICNDLFFILTDLDFKFLAITENTATGLGLVFNNSTVKKFKELTLSNIIPSLTEIKHKFEKLEDFKHSDPFEVELDLSVMKNILDNAHQETLDLITSERKKMQMTVERQHFYRKQIKFYQIKIWNPINNDINNKNIVDSFENKRKPSEKVNQVVFDDICSVGSVAGSSIPSNQVVSDNQNYTKTISDEKSSFMQSETISDATITAFERIIYFLVIPFFTLVIVDYILFYIKNTERSNQISFSNIMVQTLIITEKMNLLSRSHLNTLNGYEPKQFTNDYFNISNGFDKYNFTISNINDYVSLMSNQISSIIQNPLFYTSGLNDLSITVDLINQNSTVIKDTRNLYSTISTFKQFIMALANLPLNSTDRIIKSFGNINNSISYDLQEKNNYFFLRNIQRYLIPIFADYIENSLTLSSNLSSDTLIPIILIIIYSVVFTLVLTFILYYSLKIKKRKTIYINYFTEINDQEMHILKENCTKFFNFLTGSIVFEDFIVFNKGQINNADENKQINNKDNNEKTGWETYNLNPTSNNKENEKIAETTNNNLESGMITDNSKICLNTTPPKIIKENADDIINKVRSQISEKSVKQKKSLIKSGFGEMDISSVDNKSSKEGDSNKDSSNKVIKGQEKNGVAELTGTNEITENPPEKSEEEIRKEMKKEGILESSKKDSNNIYYFIIGGFILYGLFVYLFYSCRDNLENSYKFVQKINKANYLREFYILKVINFGREIINSKLDSNDVFYRNFTSLGKILSNYTEDDFLLSQTSPPYNFLSTILNNDKYSIQKNRYCQIIIQNFKQEGYSFFLDSQFNMNECQNVNSGLLVNGILYYIHHLKTKYQEKIDLYFLNNKNTTFLTKLLNNEDYVILVFIYLKYVAVFFDYFNDELILIYNNYLVWLATISIIEIIFFMLIILVGIYLIIKLFYLDIKNARGMICIIPSKYLKENSSVRNTNK